MDEAADRLRRARIAAGFESAAEAAARFGWVTSTYAAHENGQNSFRTKVEEYARAFKVDRAYLLWGEKRANGGDAQPAPAAEDGAIDPDTMAKAVEELLLALPLGIDQKVARLYAEAALALAQTPPDQTIKLDRAGQMRLRAQIVARQLARK